MDRKITSRLNMANAFKQICDDNQATVKKMPTFESLVATLGIKITNLKLVAKQLDTKNGGYRKDKINWKEQLSLLLSVVCGAGVSYAKTAGDIVLQEKFAFAETALSGQRDTELIGTANSIIELQETVAAQLLGNGITSDFMNEVKAALANFEAKNTLPIVNVYAGEAKREEAMKLAFELSDFVLQNMMKAALIFKITDPGFYMTLENASHISKVGVRREEVPTKQAVASNDAQGATEQKSVQEQPATTDLLENAVQEIKPVENAGEVSMGPTTNGVEAK